MLSCLIAYVHNTAVSTMTTTGEVIFNRTLASETNAGWCVLSTKGDGWLAGLLVGLIATRESHSRVNQTFIN